MASSNIRIEHSKLLTAGKKNKNFPIQFTEFVKVKELKTASVLTIRPVVAEDVATPQFATKACSNASTLTEIKLNTTILEIKRSTQRVLCL